MEKKPPKKRGMIFYASPTNRHKNKKEMVLVKKVKVAVYGSLRHGFGNFENHLKNETYIGQYETAPIYSLYDLGSFPGLRPNGTTSVVMEVFEVDAAKLRSLDGLEGYRGPEHEGTNHYNRIKIDTPYGVAFTYIYNRDMSASEDRLVQSGDWTDYFKVEKIKSYARRQV